MNAFYERSQILDVEVNPADVAGVRIRYRLQTAEYTITLSTLYQLLLLNPQRGCSILSGLCEWERSQRRTDTWAANTPCWASLGELGWEGCANEEIVLSSCGLTPPPSSSPAKPPPPPCLPTNPNPPPYPPPPPPKTHQTQKAPRGQAQVLRIEQQLIVGPDTPPWTWEGGEGEAAAGGKSGVRNPPLWKGMSHLTPCLLHRFLCRTPMVPTRGLRPRLWGGECGWNTQGKRRCFGLRGICCMPLMLQQ